MQLFDLRLVPYERFTIVSSQGADEVLAKLRRATAPPNREKTGPLARFSGRIGNNEFELYHRVTSPNIYLPVLRGEVMPTSSGCILFVASTMLFSTQVILIFWSAMALFMTGIYVLVKPNYLHASFAFIIGVGFYTISVANFHLQKNISRELLRRAIE